ncbi:MAG: NADH-quinone oxidoreductase subunit NuoH, partial [Cyanobacteria bacterium]|nr:NADH-quinone oxidoreductase subunit NuoH [Cyanobacteriota bacterium]
SLFNLSLPDSVLLVVWAVILFTGIAILGQAAVIFMVLMERKVLAWFTQRKGPNRVGPWGILQTLADGVKLLFKEDIMSPQQDKFLFTIAPAIFFLPVFVIYTLLPFTEDMLGIRIPAAALLIFALSSISVIGIVLAGWASNNKYSLMGGMRSAAQAISYEIPLVMAVLAVVLYTGSMDLKTIVSFQEGSALKWFGIWLTPISFLIFLISSIAEVNRIPFDLPEAESELVSGYNTEYSGMKFALFFLAEYAALFAMSTLMVLFFFGGYYSPTGGLLTQDLSELIEKTLNVPGIAMLVRQIEMINWLLVKTYIFIFIAMWIRGSLPRLKPDQLMGFSWKFLIPLSLINVFMIAAQRLWNDSVADIPLVSFFSNAGPWVSEVMLMNPYFWLWAGTLVFGIGGFTYFMSDLFSRQLQARISRS